MKKILLAVVIVVMVASAASALDVLGGTMGVGVKQVYLATVGGAGPFITYSPDMLPQLQVRAGWNSFTGRDPTDSTSLVSFDTVRLGVNYKLWMASIAPYIGAEFVGARAHDDSGVYDSASALYIILGAEWQVLKQASLILEWNAYTVESDFDPTVDGGIDDAYTQLLNNAITVGGILYL